MQLRNEAVVGAPLDETWRAILDVPRVARALPGATIEPEGVEGGFRGALKVRLGPVTMQYEGVARLLDADEDDHVATFHLQGRESRGQGGATATIVNRLSAEDGRALLSRYRDLGTASAEGLPWMVDNPFVRDAAALKAQLGALQAMGGGDEPESLLDVLYKVATMPATPKGAQTEEPDKWRYRSDAARVVVVFTDASFKETLEIPEAKGGSLQDVANAVMANRIILSLFAPNFEGYDRLSQIDKSEWEVVEYEGLTAQQALQKFTSDPVAFRNTLKQLAASVSRSAETVAL